MPRKANHRVVGALMRNDLGRVSRFCTCMSNRSATVCYKGLQAVYPQLLHELVVSPCSALCCCGSSVLTLMHTGTTSSWPGWKISKSTSEGVIANSCILFNYKYMRGCGACKLFRDLAALQALYTWNLNPSACLLTPGYYYMQEQVEHDTKPQHSSAES